MVQRQIITAKQQGFHRTRRSREGAENRRSGGFSMKQFFCIIVTLAASAALLWLVSAPVDNLHGAESGSDTHSEETIGGHTESVPAANAH